MKMMKITKFHDHRTTSFVLQIRHFFNTVKPYTIFLQISGVIFLIFKIYCLTSRLKQLEFRLTSIEEVSIILVY